LANLVRYHIQWQTRLLLAGCQPGRACRPAFFSKKIERFRVLGRVAATTSPPAGVVAHPETWAIKVSVWVMDHYVGTVVIESSSSGLISGQILCNI
jgi:hypothetical protein